MSTGPQPQAAFIQGHQGTVEPDATQSTILYLLQEASKLASPAHNGLLDSSSTSSWPKKMPRQDPLMVNRETKESHSSHATYFSAQHTLSHIMPYTQMMNGTEDSSHNKITTLVEPSPQCNSPWRVLSLINLQCERLLHDRGLEESDLSSKSGHSTANSSTSATDITNQVCGADSVNPEYTSGPPSLISEKEENTGCNSRTEDIMGELKGDCSEGSSGFPAQCRVNNCKVGSIVHPQTLEKIDTVRLELVDKNTTAYSAQPAHRDKAEVKLNVITGLEWKDESKDTEQGMTCNSDEDVGVALCPCVSTKECLIPKPTVMLDFNSNLALTVEPPCDTQLPSQSSLPPPSQPAVFSFSSEDESHILIEQDDKIAASEPECRHIPTEEESPPVPQSKFFTCKGETNPLPSTTSKPECIQTPTEGSTHPSPHQCSSKPTWRTKTPRKQPHPSRSADIQDPDFQGVTFRMETVLDDSREQCRLLITSKYSKELFKSVRKPRVRSRSSQNSLKTSSSDDERDLTTSISKSKVCASCCTKKTPMWRDAEDGTPLCNACGIRYKKYRVRCVNCWHIPRKEGNSNSSCLKCGNFVRLASAQRKHTA